MFEIGKTFKFEAAHRLAHHDGKCSRDHGHSYQFDLVVEASDLRLEGSQAGMVDDYDAVSEVGKWIESKLDHRDLNEVLDSDTTTAEELSQLVWEMARSRLPRLVEVRFKETEKTYASYRPRRAAERRAIEIAEMFIAKTRERLYEGVDASDPEACWSFAGSKDAAGYGYFSLVEANTKKAHRVAAWLAGDDIAGRVVLHLCDNPPCINPQHLYTGTHEENEADKDAKDRRPRGESAIQAKLNAAAVLEIVATAKAGEPRISIAQRYEVSTSLINAILCGRVWRHVTKIPRPK